jgi:hypothetical protein
MATGVSPRHLYIEAGGKGRFLVRYHEQNEDVLLISRQPLLDSAMLFLSLGCDPGATIVMRRRGSSRDDLRGTISVAAKLAVDETETIFAKWKPFPEAPVTPPSTSEGTPASRVAFEVRSRGRLDRRTAT